MCTVQSLKVRGIPIQLGKIVHNLCGCGADLSRQLDLLGCGEIRVLEHQVAVHDSAAWVAQVPSRASDRAEN